MDDQKKDKIKQANEVGEEVRVGEFVKSEDWKLVKSRLFEKLIEFDSLSAMYEGSKTKSIKALGEKAFVNGKVCLTIINWISEIETYKYKLKIFDVFNG